MRNPRPFCSPERRSIQDEHKQQYLPWFERKKPPLMKFDRIEEPFAATT
jgi:hypothetical protein